jgi:hypothetical protein
MIDDHSRLAYAEVLDDLSARCAVAFLQRAVTWFADRGVRVQAVMTDNGAFKVQRLRTASELLPSWASIVLESPCPSPVSPRVGRTWRFLRSQRGDPLHTPEGVHLTMRPDRQLVATGGNGFGLIEPFSRRSHLPEVATGCDRSAPYVLHPQRRNPA